MGLKRQPYPRKATRLPVASVWARPALPPGLCPLQPLPLATDQGTGTGRPPPCWVWEALPSCQASSPLCQVPSSAGGLSLDTCHLSGWSSPRHAWQQALVDRQPSWDRMDGYEPRRRCWRIGAGRTEGHHLYCISLCLMDHNYNTWNVCGACFPEVQSPVEYFSFPVSLSHTEAGMQAHFKEQAKKFYK